MTSRWRTSVRQRTDLIEIRIQQSSLLLIRESIPHRCSFSSMDKRDLPTELTFQYSSFSFLPTKFTRRCFSLRSRFLDAQFRLISRFSMLWSSIVAARTRNVSNFDRSYRTERETVENNKRDRPIEVRRRRLVVVICSTRSAKSNFYSHFNANNHPSR